jgi:hypothetical protein
LDCDGVPPIRQDVINGKGARPVLQLGFSATRLCKTNVIEIPAPDLVEPEKNPVAYLGGHGETRLANGATLVVVAKVDGVRKAWSEGETQAQYRGSNEAFG